MIEIVKAFRVNRKVLEKDGAYPEFVIAANIAEAMENFDFYNQEIRGMYKLALNPVDHTPAFEILRLIIHGGMINRAEKNVGGDEKITNAWQDRYEKFLSGKIPEVTKENIMKLPEWVADNKYYKVRNLR